MGMYLFDSIFHTGLFVNEGWCRKCDIISPDELLVPDNNGRYPNDDGYYPDNNGKYPGDVGYDPDNKEIHVHVFEHGEGQFVGKGYVRIV